MNKRLLLSLALASTLLGCAGLAPQTVVDNEVVSRNNAAADTLAAAMVARGAGSSPIVVATVVELDQLDRTSNFGRMVGEQLSARLASDGIKVVELKLRTSMYIGKESGEFMLSRELKDLTLEHKAAIAVVGTYAVASQDVLVTLKAVDVRTNNIVAAYSYAIPKSPVFKMLKP